MPPPSVNEYMNLVELIAALLVCAWVARLLVK